MKNRFYLGAGICLFLAFYAFAYPHSQSRNAVQKKKSMTGSANGTFEVKLTPQKDDDSTEASTPGRMLIDKQFHGDLEAVSKGQMLTAMTVVKGSAGYVAIEHVDGTLHGRKGTFVLQHNGTMTRSAQQLTITVVPDSGTEQLSGVTGKMTIDIFDGKHSYNFEYTISPAP